MLMTLCISFHNRKDKIMNDIRIDGTGTIGAGEYGLVKVDGVGRCKGDLRAESVHVDGIFRCRGGIHTRRLDCDGVVRMHGPLLAGWIGIDGMLRVEGSLTTEAMECDGMLTVYGDVKARELDVDGLMTVRGGTKIEATKITCEGMIRLNGEISADSIEADGFIRAKEIVGETVRIKSRRFGLFAFVMRRSSRIPLIEATTIELQGVRAETVNGQDVTIGRGCRIERLDCSGNLRIARGAKVKTLTGGYTLHKE